MSKLFYLEHVVFHILIMDSDSGLVAALKSRTIAQQRAQQEDDNSSFQSIIYNKYPSIGGGRGVSQMTEHTLDNKNHPLAKFSDFQSVFVVNKDRGMWFATTTRKTKSNIETGTCEYYIKYSGHRDV